MILKFFIRFLVSGVHMFPRHNSCFVEAFRKRDDSAHVAFLEVLGFIASGEKKKARERAEHFAESVVGFYEICRDAGVISEREFTSLVLEVRTNATTMWVCGKLNSFFVKPRFMVLAEYDEARK